MLKRPVAIERWHCRLTIDLFYSTFLGHSMYGKVFATLAFFMTCGLFTQFSLAEERLNWTDKSGKFSVEAEFVSLLNGKLTLKTKGGKGGCPIDC